MKQNQQFRGIGLVLLVIALITFASSLTSQGSLFSQEMTHQEFMVAVENKTIESVDINQNQQPPTGILDILLKSGDRAVVAVSDVKEAEKLLRENSIDYIVENVPQENYLMSVIIPVALSAVVIMFMFMFNDYASGLSYYYFISLLITIGQTYLFRLFVDEEKLLKKLEAKKQKPAKKSGFMARLEEAQRQQQKAMQQKKR